MSATKGAVNEIRSMVSEIGFGPSPASALAYSHFTFHFLHTGRQFGYRECFSKSVQEDGSATTSYAHLKSHRWLASNMANIDRNARRATTGPQTAVGSAARQSQVTLCVFHALLTLRFINAFVVQTFFQPDEYFQSLEPAWQLAFGPDSGAWITWVGPDRLM